MFCAQCGNPVESGVANCPGCGTAVAPAATPTSAQMAELVKARSQDAFHAFRVFALNPVGGLASAFQTLNKPQATGVGLVFAAVFLVCTTIGLLLGISRMPFGSAGIGDFLKLLLVGLVPFACIAGAAYLVRQIFHGKGGTESDVFLAGACLLPTGFLILLSGVLGWGNFEVVAALSVFALSYTILILYTGCTRLSGISESGSAVAVPIIVLIAGWLSKVVFSSML